MRDLNSLEIRSTVLVLSRMGSSPGPRVSLSCTDILGAGAEHGPLGGKAGVHPNKSYCVVAVLLLYLSICLGRIPSDPVKERVSANFPCPLI